MKFAPLIGSNLTGRLGGIVASHNTYGTYFRRYVVPVNRNTTGQQAQRNAFAIISQTWRSLNLGDQNAWTLAAPQNTVPNSTGGSLTLSGQALFMRMNTLRQRLGLAIVIAAPTSTDVPNITTPTVVMDLDGSFTMEFDAGDDWNQPGGGLLVSASPLLSAGRNFNSQYTDVGSVLGPASGPQALQIPYSTVAGGRIVFRMRATTPDGRLSDLTYTEVTTPAQAIVTGVQVYSATSSRFEFARAVDVADFATAEFTGAFRTTVTALAQDGPNAILLTGTGMNAGVWILTPAGANVAYTPPQTGTAVDA